MADQHRIRRSTALKAWESYRKRVTVHDLRGNPSVIISDRNDAVYVTLSRLLGGAIIVTRDGAIRKAGGKTTDPVSLGPLKQAVRLSVPVAHAQVGWLFLTMILSRAGVEAFSGVSKLLSDSRVQKVLLLMLLGVAVVGAIYLSDEDNRRRLSERKDRLLAELGPILDLIAKTHQGYADMKSKSALAWDAAEPFAKHQPDKSALG